MSSEIAQPTEIPGKPNRKRGESAIILAEMCSGEAKKPIANTGELSNLTHCVFSSPKVMC